MMSKTASHVHMAVDADRTRNGGMVIILAFLIQVCAANYLSFIIRYGTALPTVYAESLSFLPILLFIRLVFYLKAGLYRGFSALPSMRSQVELIKSATFGSITFFLVINYLVGAGYPRLVIALDWLFFIMISGGGSLLISLVKEYLFSKHAGKKTFHDGAGERGEGSVTAISSPREEDIAVATIVLLSSILIWSWWTTFFIPYGDDAGYYLSVAERINEGWRPYKDFYLHYTPVGLYYFAIFRELLGDGYDAYKIAFLIAELCSAGLVYLLSGSVIKNRILRFAGALLFLLLYLAYEGNDIVLEYFVVVFSLITILLLNIRTRQWFFPPFLAGLFLLLTVMAKQYGVAIIPALLVLLLKDPEGASLNLRLGIRKIAIFLLGFFVSLFLILSYFGVDVSRFLSQVSGEGHGPWGVMTMIRSMWSWRNVWFILVVFLSLVIAVRKFHLTSFIILLLCILSFSPLYVRTYLHYYQLILPYAVILLMGIVEYYFLLNPRGTRNVFEAACLFFLCVSLLFSISFAVKDTIHFSLHKEGIQESLMISRKINAILPSGSPVLVMNEPVFTYLCNFKPHVKKDGYVWLYKNGYTNFNNLDQFDFMRADNIVWFDGWRVDYKYFLPRVEKTHNKIAEFRVSGNKKVEIWKRREHQEIERSV